MVLCDTNDSYVELYRSNLKELVAAVRKGGAEVVLMTPPCWGAKAPPNGVGENPKIRLEPNVEAFRAVAREMKAPLVDHFAQWTNALRLAAQNLHGIGLSHWNSRIS
jgi:hypothetical protein